MPLMAPQHHDHGVLLVPLAAGAATIMKFEVGAGAGPASSGGRVLGHGGAGLISSLSGKVAVDYCHELVDIERLGDKLGRPVGQQLVDDVG
jgi:hypothetical protein